jgi:hypothetical protein
MTTYLHCGFRTSLYIVFKNIKNYRQESGSRGYYIEDFKKTYNN